MTITFSQSNTVCLKQLKEFHSVGREIIRQEPYRVPDSFDLLCTLILDPLLLSKGEVKLFIEGSDARLAGFYHPEFKMDGEPYVCFGLWATKDNMAAHNRIFDKMHEWAASKGVSRVIGPIDRSTAFRYRLKVNNFDRAPFYQEPHNPEYYPALLEASGYQVGHRYYSWLGSLEGQAKRFRPLVAPIMNALQQQGVQLMPLSNYPLATKLDHFYSLIDSIFSNNIGYTTPSKTLFYKLFGKSYIDSLCPHSTVIAVDRSESMVGFFLTQPNYQPLRVTKPDGYQPIFSRDYHALSPKMILGKRGGVASNYRQLGLFTAMSQQLSEWASPHYSETGAVMVHEHNASAKVASLAFGDDNRQEYALYERR